MQQLELEKWRIQLDISTFQVYLAPISRLPTEILTEIFLIHCEAAKGYTTSVTSGVWPLTYVSREWRSLALSLPVLWSDITIGVIENPAKNQLALLNTALTRSGSQPLTIHAFFSWATGSEDDINGFGMYEFEVPQTKSKIPPWPSEKQLSEAMVKAIVPHSNRWKTAEIEVLYNLSRLLVPIHGRLDSLEKLVFSGDVDDHPHIFNIAPRLRDIQFGNTPSDPFLIPWKQLTRFHESQWNPTFDPLPRFIGILLRNPQLEDFGVSYQGGRSRGDWHLTHSNLKALSCSDERLIRYLTLPKLEKLHLQAVFMNKCPPGMVPAFRDLLTRSGCASNMRVLRLQDVVLNHEIFNLLKVTPNLAELNFTFARWVTTYEGFMKELVQRMSNWGKRKEKQGKPVLIPKLELFTIDIEAINSFEWFKCDIRFIDKTFVDMVEGRRRKHGDGNGVSKIRVVKFEGYTPATLSAFTSDEVERMKKMRDERLDTYIATMDVNSEDDDRREKVFVK
ncbi:hypothetical protein GYMLUDRAFT_244030 [Collybiopsis luxurians FD-317 M1]|uniref:F-box domain-containing protein n=1 Tax=Collybiopsis luxurians FD-317 M1 TaxID=944289 RepID=A0A0D0CEC6_9AGAR|nr:hypothetical protein GYMLUDRAFT_244030 [Collybiopsis luxurians FD-317 M1]